MNQLLTTLEMPYNLVYGVLATISISIWLVSAIGLFSHSLFEGFVPHHDAGMDVDGHGGIADTTLEFLSVGKIPITIILTILFFIQAIIGVFMNQQSIHFLHLTENWQLWTMFLTNFAISFFIALITAGFVVRPLRPIFKDYGLATSAGDLIGKIATVSSSTVSEAFGTATFKLEGGDLVDISIRPMEKELMFVKGQKVLIVDFNEEKNLYFVMQA